jgi:hypothetical protein
MITHKQILNRIDNQSLAWRRERDVDECYLHLAQKNEKMIARQEAKGIKDLDLQESAILIAVRENVAIISENKRNAKIIASPSVSEDLAEAISAKMTKVEESSGCDRVLEGIAFEQCGVGIEWAETHRSDSSVGSPYLISRSPRNMTFRDESVPLSEWDRGRWMYQRKFVDWQFVASIFPDKKTEIERLYKSGGSFDWQPGYGGTNTGYRSTKDNTIDTRSTEERKWSDTSDGLVSIGCAYVKEPIQGYVVKSRSGNFIFDKNNDYHIAVASKSDSKIIKSVVDKLWRVWYCGPVELGKEEIKTGKFPLVPFYYFINGRTGYPYGLSRMMMSAVDESNARKVADLWALGALRAQVIKDYIDQPFSHWIKESSMPNKVTPIKPEALEKGGIDAVYREKREYETSEAQYRRGVDLRQQLREQGGIADGTVKMGGQDGNVGYIKPGRSNSILLSNFEYSRRAVLERLLDFVIEDSDKEEEIVIPAKVMMPKRTVRINVKAEDGIINDTRGFSANIKLDDVPSSPEMVRQEIVSLSEMAKGLDNSKLQEIIALWTITLSSLPYKEELARMARESIESGVITEEIVQRRIADAIENYKNDQMARKVDIEEFRAKADIERIEAEAELKRQQAAQVGTTMIYTAMQGGAAVAQNAAIVPAAQQILNSAGFDDKDSKPVVSSTSASLQVSPQDMSIPGTVRNTSPAMPPVPKQPLSPMAGSSEGIEKQGNQINTGDKNEE